MGATIGGQLWCTLTCDTRACRTTLALPSGQINGPDFSIDKFEAYVRGVAHRNGWHHADGRDHCPEHS